VAERARAVLATALEPGNDAVAGDDCADLLCNVAHAVCVEAGAAQPLAALFVAPRASARGSRHRLHVVAELRRHVHRRAKGGAAVAGSRLDPHLFEGAIAPEEGVCDAVEGDTAGHGRPAFAGLRVQPLDQLQHEFFQPPLNAGREIGVGSSPLLTLLPPWRQLYPVDRGGPAPGGVAAAQ